MTLAPLKIPGLEALSPEWAAFEEQQQREQAATEVEAARPQRATPAPMSGPVTTSASASPVQPAVAPATRASIAPASQALDTRSPAVEPSPGDVTLGRERTSYPPEVERWRATVAKYFRPEDVDKALYVIAHESGGNPDVPGDGGHAIGLFQHNDGGLASGRDLQALRNPEANIALAAEAVYGGQGWGPWGEGRTYKGQPFGALGRYPYTGTAAGSAAGAALAERAQYGGSASASPTGPVKPGQRATIASGVTSRAFAGGDEDDPRRTLERYVPDPAERARLQPYVDAMAQADVEPLLQQYAARKQEGATPNQALQEFYRRLQLKAIADELATRAEEGLSLDVDQATRERIAQAYIDKTGGFEQAAELLRKKGRQGTWETILLQTLATLPLPVLGRGAMGTRAFIAGSLAAPVGADIAGDIAEDVGAPGLVQAGARAAGSMLAFGAGARASAIGGAGLGRRGTIASMVAGDADAATPRLYHETTASNALGILETGTIPTGNVGQIGMYLSDTPELALGQSGKGGLVEFDARLVKVRPVSKPGQSPAMESLGREFVSETAEPRAALKITLTGPLDRATELRLKVGQRSGDLNVVKNADGSVTVTRGPNAYIEGRSIPPAESTGTGGGGAGRPPAPPTSPEMGSGSGGMKANQTPIQRLADVVHDAKKLPEETEALRHAQRSQRAAAANRVLTGSGSATERVRGARNLLFQKGEMARASYEAPGVKLDAADIEELHSRLLSSGLREYEMATAADALEKVLDGRFNHVTPNEFGLLDRVFGPELVTEIVRKNGVNWLDELMAVLSLPQTLGTSFDLSAPGRQGSVLGFSHPRQWLDAWDPMLKSGISEQTARDIDVALRKLDWVGGHTDEAKAALSFDQVGGHLSELSQFTGEAGGEAFMAGRAGASASRTGKFVRGLVPVRASERSYNTFLNQLRGRVYAREAERMWQAGVRAPEQYKALAAVVNHASGWSEHSIGQLQSGRAGINVFFSPRLLLSRFQTVLDPIVQPGSLLKPSARQLAAKNLAAMVLGEAGLITTIAALTGADVSWNPVDTDFGKLVYGNTRVDLLGGFSPLVRTLARISSAAAEEAGLGEGEGVSSGGNAYDVSIAGELIRFFRNKESPLAALVTNLAVGEDAIGRDAPLTAEYIAKQLGQGMIPFFLRDVSTAFREEGAKGLATTSPSFFGASVLTYPPSAAEDRGNARDRAAQELFGKPYDGLLPTQQSAVNRDPAVMAADARVQESGKDTSYGQYRAAKQAAYGGIQKQQDRAEASFQRGTLSQPIADWWHDLGEQRKGARAALEASFKKTLDSFEQDRFDVALDGYYGIEYTKDDGKVDWDRTEQERRKYIDSLSQDEGEWLMDYLDLQQENQSPLRQRYFAYLDDKESAGYFRDDITQAEREALDRANPDLDVEGWYFNGGVKDGPVPALQTAAAVEQALRLVDEQGLKNRQVKLAGLDRVINASPKTLEAWRQYGSRIENFMNKAVTTYGDRDAQRRYGKNFAALDDRQKQAVASGIRAGLRLSSPDLDAALAWFGYGESDGYYILHSKAAGEKLKAIQQSYGTGAPKDGSRWRYSQNAR